MRELEFAVNAGDGVLLARKLFQITEIMRHTYSEQKEALAAEGGDTIAGRRRALREARQAVDGDPFASRIRALQTKLYKDLDGISHKDLTMALMALGPEVGGADGVVLLLAVHVPLCLCMLSLCLSLFLCTAVRLPPPAPCPLTDRRAVCPRFNTSVLKTCSGC